MGGQGSFLEVENIIEPLTNPPSEELPAFHVVAPSIPGFGFSPSPKKPGFGYRQVGKTFHALMQKLGYDKFVFQGGRRWRLHQSIHGRRFPRQCCLWPFKLLDHPA